jgi:hypothetical protein
VIFTPQRLDLCPEQFQAHNFNFFAAGQSSPIGSAIDSSPLSLGPAFAASTFSVSLDFGVHDLGSLDMMPIGNLLGGSLMPGDGEVELSDEIINAFINTLPSTDDGTDGDETDARLPTAGGEGLPSHVDDDALGELLSAAPLGTGLPVSQFLGLPADFLGGTEATIDLDIDYDFDFEAPAEELPVATPRRRRRSSALKPLPSSPIESLLAKRKVADGAQESAHKRQRSITTDVANLAMA